MAIRFADAFVILFYRPKAELKESTERLPTKHPILA
jgi:hypothetical protein